MPFIFELGILVLIGWGIANVLGLAGGHRDDKPRLHNPERDPVDSRRSDGSFAPQRSETTGFDARATNSGGALPSPPPMTQQLSPRMQREKQMVELRRRYVADEITVEEYEAELDKLIRERPEA